MFSPNMPLRWSKWVHFFRKDGADHFAMFHTLQVKTVFVESSLRGLIERFRVGTTPTFVAEHLRKDNSYTLDVCRTLFDAGFLVRLDEDDMVLLQTKKDQHVRKPGLETLYLLVTDKCNLRCKYCFINNGMPRNYVCSAMTWNVAQTAVDMYFTNLTQNPPEYEDFVKMIVFYGGEPLSNFGLIKKVVLYVKQTYGKQLLQMGEMFRFSIVTNATLITEEIARFFGEHRDIDIAISLDGLEHINDQKRIGINGEGSFARVIKGYELLRNVGMRRDIAISCTVDVHNIDHLRDLLLLNERYEFPAINLNPLLDTERRLNTKKAMRIFSLRALEYFVLARERGVYEDRIMRKATSFAEQEIFPYDCQATGAQLVCSPNGQLGVCHEGVGAKNFFFARLRRDFRFHNHPVIKEWKRRTPLNMPQCWECRALGICGGGCAYGAWIRSGTIWAVDDRFCVHARKTLEWLIWDLFERL